MGLALLDRAQPRQGQLGGAPWERDNVRGHAGRGGAGSRPGALFELEPHGAATLDELVTAAWQGLVAGETVSCPACGSRMVPRKVDSSTGRAGGCVECGATLF
jgi:hypothetical protein